MAKYITIEASYYEVCYFVETFSHTLKHFKGITKACELVGQFTIEVYYDNVYHFSGFRWSSVFGYRRVP